jgi:AbrB family looped-hinge helix DNA binding protein
MNWTSTTNPVAGTGSYGERTSRIELIALKIYSEAMKATITSRGRITIPLRLREKFHLNAGDQLEFDENASVLVARRVVDLEAWESTLADWRESRAEALRGHPWEGQASSAIIDDLRCRPADSIQPRP